MAAPEDNPKDELTMGTRRCTDGDDDACEECEDPDCKCSCHEGGYDE